MTEPPSKLHELLALALNDYDVTKNDSEYFICMGFWHHYIRHTDICYVCLAGCVMAQTLKVFRKETVATTDVYGCWTYALESLNNLREGINPFTFFHMFTVSDHQAFPELWRQDMQHFIEYLQLQDL